MAVTKRKAWVSRNVEAKTHKSIIAPPKCQLIPLVDGPEIFGEIERAMENAKEYIYFTTWILEHVDVRLRSKTLKAIFEEKVKRGVDVRALISRLDAFMTGKTRAVTDQNIEKTKSALEGIGVKVHVSQMHINSYAMKGVEWLAGWAAGGPVVLASYHQKTLAMDDGKGGPVAFCNGCDITKGSGNKAAWHDASLEAKGNCAKGIVENFEERWRRKPTVFFGHADSDAHLSRVYYPQMLSDPDDARFE